MKQISMLIPDITTQVSVFEIEVKKEIKVKCDNCSNEFEIIDLLFQDTIFTENTIICVKCQEENNI